jgi:hypothetical protein
MMYHAMDEIGNAEVRGQIAKVKIRAVTSLI